MVVVFDMTTVNVKDFGAVGDGVVDDGPAIVAAIGDGLRAPINDTSAVYFPGGKYLIGSTQQPSLREKGMRLFGEVDGNGEPVAEMVFDDKGFGFYADEVDATRQGAVLSDALRGATEVFVNVDARVAQPNDIISVRNTASAEIQWNIPALYTGLCTEVSRLKDWIVLSHPLPFDFLASAQGNIVSPLRHRGQLVVENLGFRQRSTNPVPAFTAFGMRSPRFTNLRLTSDTPLTNDVLLLHRCVGAEVNGVYMCDANIGILVSECLDTTISEIKAYVCHHPISPVNWSDRVYVDDLLSVWSDSGLDAHPSFNVHYSNFECYNKTGANLRSMGGSLKNGRSFSPVDSGGQFQTLELVDQSIYLDYEFEMSQCHIDLGKVMEVGNIGKCTMRDSQIAYGLQLGGTSNPNTPNMVHNIDIRGLETPSILFENTDVLQGQVIYG